MLNAVKNMIDFSRDPITFIDALHAAHPEYAQEAIGPKSFLFIFSPDLLEQVLIKNADNYPQNRIIFDKIKPITGDNGLVQLQGQKSKEERTRVKALFSTDFLNQSKQTISEYCEDLFNTLDEAARKGERVDISSLMNNLVLRTAFKIFVGSDINRKGAELARVFLLLNELCGQRIRSVLAPPLFLPTVRNLKIKRFNRSLNHEVRRLLADKSSSHDVVSLIQLYKDDPSLYDQIFTFLFAGHETTAASLTFTFQLLAQYENYQDQIRSDDKEEITQAIYKESLRLFPPAWILAREALKDDDLGQCRVRKSDQVIIGVRQIQRSPLLWENANTFMPERFLNRQPLSHKFAFAPFGVGMKACVGIKLAYVEATIILQLLLQRYQFIANSSEPIKLSAMITAHPKNNLQVSLKRIDNSKKHFLTFHKEAEPCV